MEGWLVYAIASAVLLGIINFVVKLSTHYDSYLFLFYFLALLLSSLAFLVPLILKGKLSIPTKEVILLAVIYGTLYALALYLMYRAFSVGKAGLVGSILAINPLITASLAYFFLGETLSLKQILGIVIILLGVVLLT
jgi:transporter family protein